MLLDETKECLDEMQFSCDIMYLIKSTRDFINCCSGHCLQRNKKIKLIFTVIGNAVYEGNPQCINTATH
jgi:hypothetical protein